MTDKSVLETIDLINLETAQRFYKELNTRFFENKLPNCRLELSNRLTRTAGKIWPKLRLMRLSLPYHQRYGPDELRNTILHEMIHLWLYEQKLPSGHTPLFRRKLIEVGLPDRIRALPVPPRPYKYLYACPTCGYQVQTRRKINSSCGRCDKVYNPRHKFKLLKRLEQKSLQQEVA
jgi:predicted SprT family Zn-dependent metalloprotease